MRLKIIVWDFESTSLKRRGQLPGRQGTVWTVVLGRREVSRQRKE